MGWTETHQRWQVLREVEAELAVSLAAGPVVRLPWREEYAALFGDRATLVAMLRYRLRLAEEAQLDPRLPEDVREEQQRLLAARTAGVRRLLEQYDAGGVHVAA
jgi:exoribonuclease II